MVITQTPEMLRTRAQRYFDTREQLLLDRNVYSRVVLGNLIAEGGFAMVFDGMYSLNHSGRAPGNAVPIAAKIFRPEMMFENDPVLSEVAHIRFMREAVRTEELSGLFMNEYKDLKNPVPRVLRYDMARPINSGSELWYILFQKENGRSLKKVIDHKPLEISRVGSIGYPLARTISVVHKRGLVHRDIKPENVHVRSDDSPVLLDFGLVKPTEDFGGSASPWLAGTPGFIPPEVLLGTNTAPNPRADVYSLGAVLYNMLTGFAPYTHLVRELMDVGNVTFSLRDRRSNDGNITHPNEDIGAYTLLYDRNTLPRPISSVRTDLSLKGKNVEEAILASLSIDPLKRPSTVELTEVVGMLR